MNFRLEAAWWIVDFRCESVDLGLEKGVSGLWTLSVSHWIVDWSGSEWIVDC